MKSKNSQEMARLAEIGEMVEEIQAKGFLFAIGDGFTKLYRWSPEGPETIRDFSEGGVLEQLAGACDLIREGLAQPSRAEELQTELEEQQRMIGKFCLDGKCPSCGHDAFIIKRAVPLRLRAGQLCPTLTRDSLNGLERGVEMGETAACESCGRWVRFGA